MKNNFAFGVEVKYTGPGKVSLHCYTWKKRKTIDFPAEYAHTIDVATDYFKRYSVAPIYHTEHKDFYVFVFDRKHKIELARAMNFRG